MKTLRTTLVLLTALANAGEPLFAAAAPCRCVKRAEEATAACNFCRCCRPAAAGARSSVTGPLGCCGVATRTPESAFLCPGCGCARWTAPVADRGQPPCANVERPAKALSAIVVEPAEAASQSRFDAFTPHASLPTGSPLLALFCTWLK